MYPLYDILRGRKPTPKVDWSAEGDAAFAAATLAHRSPHTPIAMTTDPLDYVVVAVHKQWINGTWQPLDFFSRQQRPAERQHSTFDRELLLCTWLFGTVVMLQDRPLTAFVAHKPLTFAMVKLSEPWSTRQQRHLARPTWWRTASLSPWLVLFIWDYAHMATDQATDHEVQALHFAETGLKLRRMSFSSEGVTLM